MTDCGCDKAKAELEEYLHNELCSADAQDIREHLANCPDCTSEHHVGRGADRGRAACLQGGGSRGAARPGARAACARCRPSH